MYRLPIASLWYVSAYLLCYFFYIFLVKLFSSYRKEKSYLYYGVVAIISYVVIMLIKSSGFGVNATYERMIGCLPVGVMRGIAGMGIGILALRIRTYVNSWFQNLKCKFMLFLIVLASLTYFYCCDVTVEFDYLNYYFVALGLVFIPNDVKMKKICKFNISESIFFIHGVVLLVISNITAWQFEGKWYLLLYVTIVIISAYVYELIMNEIRSIAKRRSELR